jgi:hypothetical protein
MARFQDVDGWITKRKLIRLGEVHAILLNAHGPDGVWQLIDEYIDLLDYCDLPNAHDLRAPLKDFGFKTIGSKKPNWTLLGPELRLRMESCTQALANQSQRQKMIALDIDAVPVRLRGLSNRLTLDKSQQDLQAETIRSLESGAYRSAQVMMWNLAYDYIRRWVFVHKLTEFNSKLDPSFQPVSLYEDFWENKPWISESRFVTTCDAAKIIPPKQAAKLHGLLHRRNDHAHPNFTQPLLTRTQGYVEDVVDAMEDQPFPKPVI